MHLEKVIAFVESTPWAVRPDHLRVIEGILARRAAGERTPDAVIEAAVGKKKDSRPARQPGGVGVLGIYGTITQRADLMSEWSGGTSADQLGQWLDQLAADPAIETILLDVDSPGGSVYGIEELAQKIQAVAKQKKVVGVANSVAASAAYWLLSQASEVVVTPNGEVGSIGVYVMHVDRSEALRQQGQRVSFIKAGERKTAGNPYGPLDGLGQEELQAGVDDYYAKFVKAVARGRNTSQTAVRDGFGRGGMVRAEQAVREGMADRVGTLESVLGRYGLSAADLRATADRPAPVAKVTDPGVEIRRRRLLLDQG